MLHSSCEVCRSHDFLGRAQDRSLHSGRSAGGPASTATNLREVPGCDHMLE